MYVVKADKSEQPWPAKTLDPVLDRPRARPQAQTKLNHASTLVIPGCMTDLCVRFNARMRPRPPPPPTPTSTRANTSRIFYAHKVEAPRVRTHDPLIAWSADMLEEYGNDPSIPTDQFGWPLHDVTILRDVQETRRPETGFNNLTTVRQVGGARWVAGGAVGEELRVGA